LRRAARILAAAALGALVLAAAGCGAKHHPPPSSPTARRLHLDSEDLVAVAQALGRAAPFTQREIAAARGAWPLIYDGLPVHTTVRLRGALELALARTQQIVTPPLFQEEKAATLTGPGSELAGLYRGFTILAERGWKMTLSAAELNEQGPSVARKFARENVGLYIESIYDAHFQLAQIGRLLENDYGKLGGPTEFEGPLTQTQVQGLALIYSELNARLYPHVQALLGS
jgi:hypothetical protein